MNIIKETKINQLLQKWPQGTVATTPWLKEQGISSLLMQAYQKTGWVQSIGHGAFIRRGDRLSWQGALFPLQSQLHLNVHVGGKSSLELQGYAHFIKFRDTSIYLYAQPGKKIPLWFTKLKLEETFSIHKTSLLNVDIGLISHPVKDFSIKISSPERAFLELLYLVPYEQDLQECYYLLENLINLRPSLLQILLEQVHSIKVKRLFLFLADKLNHPWLDRLDRTKILLGSGKRKIVDGGVLDKKYLITIPQELTDKNE